MDTNENFANDNTELDLQALFDSVLTPSAANHHPQQVPWSKRKLPDSFFHPPTTGSKSINHSRDSSSDSGTFTSAGTLFTVSPLNSVPLQTIHHRAHSSPASFHGTQTQSLAERCSSQNQRHIKQLSYDATGVNNFKTPLPYGWEEAVTSEGNLYYLNHITKTTTWEDPRKSSPSTPISSVATNASRVTTVDFNNPPNPLESLSLPEGWEQSVTPEGEIYFINHITKTTSWFDPRILHLQQSSSSLPYYNTTALTDFGDSKQHQDLRLRQLHLERKKLQERREQLRKQQILGVVTDHYRQESSDSAFGESLKEWMPIEVTMTESLQDGNIDEIEEGNLVIDIPEIDIEDNIDAQLLIDKEFQL